MSSVIIHISDLHIGYDRCLFSTNTEKQVSNKQNIDNIVNAIKSKFKNDVAYHLLITGDIANTAAQNEYKVAETIISKFKDDLNATIIIIPGDHDWNVTEYTQIREQADTTLPEKPLGYYKYQKFNDYFYKPLTNKDFDYSNCIFENTNIGDNVLLLSLNSTIKITNKGDYGNVDINKLETELTTIKNNNRAKTLLMATHHNVRGKYEQKINGQWEESEVAAFLKLLNKNEIRCLFFGNEHTRSSDVKTTFDVGDMYLSDSGTLSGNIDNNAKHYFKCYEIKEEYGISLKNHIFCIDGAGTTDHPFECKEELDWDNIKEEVQEFAIKKQPKVEQDDNLIVERTDKQSKKEKNNTENEEQNDTDEAVEKTPKFIPYSNNEISDKLFNLIKSKKLYHSGHFHWGEKSRALNWIDTLKLLEDKNDLMSAKNAIIDVIEHIKKTQVVDKFDLIIGLGFEGTMIATKAAIKADVQISFLPYPYRKETYNKFENTLNFEENIEYKNIIIVTDVVHSASSIITILDNPDNKQIFDKADNIFVISLICTGKENLFKLYSKVKFYYVLQQLIIECPYNNNVTTENSDNYKDCPIFKDKLSEVLCFYNDKKE